MHGAAERVIVALDYSEAAPALQLAQQLVGSGVRLKVGKELFTRAGPSFVEQLHSLGFSVFLDLKFHDIPTTVAKACAAAARLGVWMINVHGSGGLAMMTAAREALAEHTPRPLLIAVTVLTSMDAAALAQVGITATPQQQVLRLAGLAHRAGLDGVVCSAWEAPALRAAHGPTFTLVTPGIRPATSALDDQSRAATPARALALGSDYLVIGRPITTQPDPLRALAEILTEIAR